MGAGIGPGNEHTHADCETPCQSDHHPSGILSLTLVQRYTRTYTVSEKYQDKCSNQFHQELGRHRIFHNV